MRQAAFIRLSVSVAFCVALDARGQKPRDAPPEPKRGETVVALGCVKGSVLESTDTESTDGTGRLTQLVTYRLTGDKDVLKVLKREHDGHIEEITGVLKSELATNEKRGKQFGKTRIVVGVGPSARADGQQPQPLPVLSVKSFRHIAASCGRS
jgi:hypothetical protein